MHIIQLLAVWFVVSIPVAFFVGAVFQLSKPPFDGISCPRCGAGADQIVAENDEFKCEACGHLFYDPMETEQSQPMRLDDDGLNVSSSG